MVHHGEKLKEFVRNSGETDIIVAKKLGISRATLQNYYLKPKLKDNQLDEFAKCLKIDKALFSQNLEVSVVKSENEQEAGSYFINSIKSLYERMLAEKDKEIEYLRKLLEKKI